MKFCRKPCENLSGFCHLNNLKDYSWLISCVSLETLGETLFDWGLLALMIVVLVIVKNITTAIEL